MSAHAAPSSGGSEEGLTKIRTTIRRVILGSTILATVLVVTLVLFAWHPWTDWGSAFGGQGGSTAYRAQASAQCPGVVQTVSLNTTSALRVNPGYVCNIYFRVDKGVALLAGPNGSWEFGPEGKFVDEALETAQAARGTAEMRYVLCSGKKHNFDTWDCE